MYFLFFALVHLSPLIYFHNNGSSARVTMSITMPAVSQHLGWDKQVSGTALSAFFCGYVCTNILGGHLADRVGGETVICYAGVGWALLTTILPFLAEVKKMYAYHLKVWYVRLGVPGGRFTWSTWEGYSSCLDSGSALL